MTKRATQNYVAYRKGVARWSVLLLTGALIAGCGSNDYGGQTSDVAPPPPTRAQATAPANGVAPPAAFTGADGYPNINVNTAQPARTPVHTAEERDRMEAELMALGARQRGGTDRPQSVVQELQELGRRSKADAEKAISSGAPPADP